ncbi:MAG: flagellar biosynthesis protein FlhB [Alphaproteobacteria bacterium]|nr:flagellar biosynthesis protein FlhB [Alphaproteobacteria bacterium]
MAEDQQDPLQKTEEPTQKKIDDSRRKGQVATSREVNTWFILLGGAIILVMMAPDFMADLKGVLGRLIAYSHDLSKDSQGIGILLSATVMEIGGILILPLGLLVVLAALSSLVQHGPIFSVESLKPKFEKISPAKGLKRMFSSRSIMEFIKGVLKLVIVGAVAALVMIPELEGLGRLTSMHTADFLHVLWQITSKVMIAVFAVVTVIAALDMLYQKMQHLKQLRMSRQEIKDEMKQTDGDPMVKARLRQIRMERARQRMMQAVPESTVVVTNPTHFAVALKYDQDEMEEPEVVAKGADLMAKRIREVAQENDVPLVENPVLARALYAGVEIGAPVPTEHYRAVAEVIGYVMRLKRPRPTA